MSANTVLLVTDPHGGDGENGIIGNLLKHSYPKGTTARARSTGMKERGSSVDSKGYSKGESVEWRAGCVQVEK